MCNVSQLVSYKIQLSKVTTVVNAVGQASNEFFGFIGGRSATEMDQEKSDIFEPGLDIECSFLFIVPSKKIPLN